MGRKEDKVSVRPFEPADGPFCHALRREAFLKVFSADLDERAVRTGAEAFDPDEFERLIGGLDSFVAIEGTVRVGFCTIRYPEREKAEILYLYIDPGHRGTGIGTLLMHHAERWIAERHPEVTSIVLDTAVPSYNQGFYEGFGYRELGPIVCRYPDGEIPAVRLIKPIRK
jgi:ribosomal protein S18 acetylase RimI-like enzyme